MTPPTKSFPVSELEEEIKYTEKFQLRKKVGNRVGDPISLDMDCKKVGEIVQFVCHVERLSLREGSQVVCLPRPRTYRR